MEFSIFNREQRDSCPYCGRFMYICSQKKGQFVSREKCWCNKEYWRFICNCNQHVYTTFKIKPKLGDTITCKLCNKHWQFTKCPNCSNVTYWNNKSYEIGQLVKCFSCKTLYKQIQCKCGQVTVGNQNTVFTLGKTEVVCNKCKQRFRIISCKQCSSAINISLAQPIYTKPCSICSTQHHLLFCPFCKQFQQSNKAYQYGKAYTCASCKKGFSYSMCIECFNVNYEDCKEYGLRKCFKCRKRYWMVCCQKCGELLTDKYQKNDLIQPLCSKCNHQNNLIICCQIIQTPKQKIHYCTKCLKKYQKEQNVKQKPKEKNISKKEQERKDSTCKICLEETAEFLMKQCGHLIYCQTCIKKVTSTHKCPICRLPSSTIKLYK